MNWFKRKPAPVLTIEPDPPPPETTVPLIVTSADGPVLPVTIRATRTGHGESSIYRIPLAEWKTEAIQAIPSASRRISCDGKFLSWVRMQNGVLAVTPREVEAEAVA